MALCELVKVRTENGIRLGGAYYKSKKAKAGIVHVHGSCGNFYEAEFVRVIADAAANSELAFLTFNLRGHDCIAEAYGDDDHFEYVGGSVQLFDSCVKDIHAAIQFIKKDVDQVFLQGHSLGCDRIVHYLISEGDHDRNVTGVVLLAPCDSYALHESYIAPETVEEQIERIKESPSGETIQLLDNKEYGVQHDDEEYYIPVTKHTLLSIIRGPPFRLFNLRRPSQYYIDKDALVVIGGNDSLQMQGHQEMFSYLNQRLHPMHSAYLEHADHDFGGFETELARTVVEFIRRSLTD